MNDVYQHDLPDIIYSLWFDHNNTILASLCSCSWIWKASGSEIHKHPWGDCTIPLERRNIPNLKKNWRKKGWGGDPSPLDPPLNLPTQLTSAGVWVQFSWWFVISGPLSEGNLSSIIWKNNAVEKQSNNNYIKILEKIVVDQNDRFQHHKCMYMYTKGSQNMQRKFWARTFPLTGWRHLTSEERLSNL